MAGDKHDLCAELPKVLPIRGQDELRLVLDRAAANGHGNMILPSHVVLKRGDILGCLSLGNVALAHCWLDSRLKPMETALVFAQAENELQRAGFKLAVITCPAGAPLHDKLERHFGYEKLGQTTVFSKRLA